MRRRGPDGVATPGRPWAGRGASPGRSAGGVRVRSRPYAGTRRVEGCVVSAGCFLVGRPRRFHQGGVGEEATGQFTCLGGGEGGPHPVFVTLVGAHVQGDAADRPLPCGQPQFLHGDPTAAGSHQGQLARCGLPQSSLSGRHHRSHAFPRADPPVRPPREVKPRAPVPAGVFESASRGTGLFPASARRAPPQSVVASVTGAHTDAASAWRGITTVPREPALLRSPDGPASLQPCVGVASAARRPCSGGAPAVRKRSVRPERERSYSRKPGQR